MLGVHASGLHQCDTQIYTTESLLVAPVRTSDGKKIKWYQRLRSNSVTRACQAILHLSDETHRQRA
jgi:hypothetical protein